MKHTTASLHHAYRSRPFTLIYDKCQWHGRVKLPRKNIQRWKYESIEAVAKGEVTPSDCPLTAVFRLAIDQTLHILPVKRSLASNNNKRTTQDAANQSSASDESVRLFRLDTFCRPSVCHDEWILRGRADGQLGCCPASGRK